MFIILPQSRMQLHRGRDGGHAPVLPIADVTIRMGPDRDADGEHDVVRLRRKPDGDARSRAPGRPSGTPAGVLAVLRDHIVVRRVHGGETLLWHGAAAKRAPFPFAADLILLCRANK